MAHGGAGLYRGDLPFVRLPVPEDGEAGSPVTDRLGRQHLALCRVPGDALKEASLAITMVAPDPKTLQQRLDGVLRTLEDGAVVVRLEHEVL